MLYDKATKELYEDLLTTIVKVALGVFNPRTVMSRNHGSFEEV